jgi:uncharacterized membrane protein YfcA
MLLVFNFSSFQWILMMLGTAIIGLSKAGIKGIDMMNVTIMAMVFGGKASTGVILPLLCFADILAVFYYKRHVQWHYFKRLIPPMLIGVVVGAWWGKDIDERLFKKIMAIIILLTVVLMFWMEKRKSQKVPTTYFFSNSMGFIAGFTTMLGNLAGAFSNIYFLALKLSKNDFIGTAAWVFFTINLIKVPFQFFIWKNINVETLTIDIFLIPSLIVGFTFGIKLVGKIDEIFFRKLIMTLTLIGSFLIFFI